jgi:type I site-specific restriction-modification system R (restriction) subunit
VALYQALVALRPDWHSDDDEQGALKVVMTGSASDPLEWQGHIRNKTRRETMAQRFRDPGDPFRIVIVRDMLKEKYEVCVGLFHGFDWAIWLSGTAAERLTLLAAAQEQVLAQDDGKTRLLRAVRELSRAFALAVPHEDAIQIRDDVGFFQAVRAALAKGAPNDNEIRERSRRNVVQAKSFAEMLERSVRKYQNRAIETAQEIEELIQLARDLKAAEARGESLGLSDDELAFYDALETNDSAVQVLGDDTLEAIARELVETVRKNVTIDWTIRENVRAQLRVYVKRILRKHGYPPDKQEQATRTVLEQAEVLSDLWAAA